MKYVDQKRANRVGGVFHAPMQATCSSTEPAHYSQHGHLPFPQRRFVVDWRLHADGFSRPTPSRNLRGSTKKSNRLPTSPESVREERAGSTVRSHAIG